VISIINNKYKWNICKTKKLILSFNTFFYFDKIRIKFKNYKKNFSFRTSFIYKKMKYPVIVSKKKTLFSLNKYGFMYLSEFLFKNIFFDQTLCNLKKKLYSFSYKNEFQRYVLKRFIRRHSILNLLPVPNKKTFLMRQTSLRWKINDDKIWDDVNIKRIRFKPGYMTLWRDARQVLKLSLNLKMRYQYKLTSYLAKYNKFIKIKTFLMFELQLGNVLLKTRLLPDMNSTNLFIEHCLVFVNGMVCNNASFQIFTGDFIQLVVSLKYYILYKWFLNWEFKKVLRLRHIAKKKLIIRQNADEKTRSHLLPKWILFSKNSFSDVSKYLEIDYFTLSIFILYEPFRWSDVNPFTFADTKFGVINLYNWKYIT
jgi:ribosomal protein S4